MENIEPVAQRIEIKDTTELQENEWTGASGTGRINFS